jgi:acyl carrier protein
MIPAYRYQINHRASDETALASSHRLDNSPALFTPADTARHRHVHFVGRLLLQDGNSSMHSLEEVKNLVSDTLGLGERGATLTADSPLLGAIPELDSMAVINLITALEEQYGFSIADDEISAEVFDTLGSLAAFVDRKLA